MISFYLNGKENIYCGEDSKSLLVWLRQEKKITSVKDGCSGEGTCGACLVEIDGKARLACKTAMGKMGGAKIVTIEGFPENVRGILAKAFVSSAAVQCGFCTPGFLTRAKILLDNNLNPTRDEVIKAVRPHLCRCTGYIKIVDAILLAASIFRGEKSIKFEAGRVGLSPPKYHAYEKALGIDAFVDDIYFDDMLHGALYFSEHPRAKILKIDLREAKKVSGVVAIFTAKDVPGKINMGSIVRDWPLYIGEGEITHFIGDVLACVVAEDEEIAREAVGRIKVEYEVLQPVTDVRDSLKGKIKLHKNGNILKKTTICYGKNVKDVFKNSAYVTSKNITTQLIEHAYMEVEASIAMPEDDGVVVYTQGQGIFEDRTQIADLLNLEKGQVKVRLRPAGGAFGGKEDLSAHGHAALAAYKLKKKVKVKLNRSESIRMSTKRHPMIMDYTIGCDEKGKFTALYARIAGDTGAYASVGAPVMDRAATHAGGAYYIPNIDAESMAVYTNNLPCGAMRGFGVNQVTFAVEVLIDDLCQMGGFDRWEIRYLNALDTGLTTTSGHRLKKEVGLKRTLESVKDMYRNSEYVGIACGIKNCGIGNGLIEESEVMIEVLADRRFMLYHGWSEMGQGIDTVAGQIICESLGFDDISSIDVISTTEYETVGGSTTASRGTYLIGKAILAAVEKLKKDLSDKTLNELVGNVYRGRYVCDWTTSPGYKGEMVSHFAYSFATHLVLLDNNGDIKRIIGSHDSGRIVNRKLFEGQVQGGIVMGLGYALSENLLLEDAKPKTTKLGKLGLLRSTDVPENIDVITIETEDIDAPYGAKGVGEISSIPTAAAVASAYRYFDGKARYSLPLTPLSKK